MSCEGGSVPTGNIGVGERRTGMGKGVGPLVFGEGAKIMKRESSYNIFTLTSHTLKPPDRKTFSESY